MNVRDYLPGSGKSDATSGSGRKPESNSPSGFGMFGGVFTPCTLTILGVIMFLRYGYVVGNAGLLLTLLILASAKIITTLTTLSLSAIATNTKVKGGGAYFLISRSLGAEFGGAIGIVFFFAQAISVAMYVIGFTEAFDDTFSVGLGFKVIATIVNLIVFACVYIGAGWTIKIQYFILAILVASLISFFVGGAYSFEAQQLSENWQSSFSGKENTWTMFALFFPAVTGIMAGANMSGDLKDPSRSIPSGTFLSILATGIIYCAMAIMLAGCRSSDFLIDNRMVVGDIASWPILITAGVFAATLSSALGSMMGAPRILQALAKDSIFSSLTLFGAGSGAAAEPRRAIIVTFIIAQICILVADLDTIAPLITMAFMITYGTINLATFYESITKNPSYRPSFKYSHWSTSLLGAIGCLAVMLLIDYRWAAISIAAMSVIYYGIYRKQMVSRWGDLNSGLLFERARKSLLKLEKYLYHPKNWRPIVLVMSGGGWTRPKLAIYGHWLTSGHGILSLGQVIQGDLEDRLDRIENQERILQNFIETEELEAFPNVVAAPYLTQGIEYLIQCHGLGSLRPNTIMLGLPNNEQKADAIMATLRTISGLNRNIILSRLRDLSEDPWAAPAGNIDVWWRGYQNGELMLLLAHLLKQNDKWRTKTIRLMRIVSDDAAREEVLRHLNELASSSRIEVNASVLVSQDPTATIQSVSAKSAMTFLGLEIPAEGTEREFYERLEQLAGPIPRTMFVNSTGNMKLES